jgi:hypothetical protein
MRQSLYSLNAKCAFDWEIVKDGGVHGLIPKEFDNLDGNLDRPSNRGEAMAIIARMNEHLIANRERKRKALLKQTKVFVRHCIRDIMKQKTTAVQVEEVALKIMKGIPIMD